MAAACADWDVVACADWGGAACADVDAELVHAASETIARQSETAIATDLPAVPARGPAAPSPASVNAAFVVALTAILPGPANAPVIRIWAGGCGEGARRRSARAVYWWDALISRKTRWVAGHGQEIGPRYFTIPVDGILVYPRGGVLERLARLAGVAGSQFTVVVNEAHVPFTALGLGL